MDDPRIDIYAMGVTMYQTLCKKIPFEEAFDRERRGELQFMVVQRMVERQTPKPPSEIRGDIPKELSDIIMECLEKDPEKRPPSAKVIKNALERCSRKLQAAHTQKRVQEPLKPQAAQGAGHAKEEAGLTMVMPPKPAQKRAGKVAVAGAIAGVLAAAGFATVMFADSKQSRGDRIPASYVPDGEAPKAAEPPRPAKHERPARKTFQLTFVTEPGEVDVFADGEKLCRSSGEGVCTARVEEGPGREFEFRKDGHSAKSREIAPDSDMVVKVRLEPEAVKEPPALKPAPPAPEPPQRRIAPPRLPRVENRPADARPPAENRPAEPKPPQEVKPRPRITDEGDAPKKPRITDEGG
jgi:serine/threonine-protein kinase